MADNVKGEIKNFLSPKSAKFRVLDVEVSLSGCREFPWWGSLDTPEITTQDWGKTLSPVSSST